MAYVCIAFMSDKKILSIAVEHIEPGIKKYEGRVDTHLSAVIKAAGLSYTPYIFKDGRILLVMPSNSAAFLYPNQGILYDALSLG
jgi:hypothetical protein